MVKFIHYMILAFICFSNYPISFAHDSNNLYKKLYKLVLPRAKQGDIPSQFNLGKMYQQGLGISKDLQKAAKWYRLAAEQDHPEAQFNLGGMYYQGLNFPKNYQKAAKWYRLAAKQGHASAQYNLGYMYLSLIHI